jgi:alpha-tubulin suppressor-like RCC1 family protein
VLWAWGLNRLGQAGMGSKENKVSMLTKVTGPSQEELCGDAVVGVRLGFGFEVGLGPIR